MTLKLCQLIEYYIRAFVLKNDVVNVHQKLIPDPFLILLTITQNSHCMQGILLQIRYSERELSKSF